MRWTRKQFLEATLGAAAASVVGCGDDAGTGGQGGGAGGAGGSGGSSTSTTTSTSTTGGGGAGGGTGGASGGGGAMSATCEDGTQVTIGTNHGHELVVSTADVLAGMDKTYDIQGTSLHPHSATLTAAHFQMLLQGSTITVTSTTDSNHSHQVAVVCA